MRRCICVLLFSLVICTSDELYSEIQTIPKEVLFGNPGKQFPRISPDGKRLAFLAPDSNNILNILMKNLNEAKEECVTFNKQGIHSFFWRYDSSAILYLQDRNGDENTHLYQTDLVTKQTCDLTPFEGSKVKIVAYIPTMPHEILCAINAREKAKFDIYRINLKTKTWRLEFENQWSAFKYKADNQLQIRACMAYDAQGNMIIRVRDDRCSPWRELMHWGLEDYGDLLSFSPDGKWLNMIISQGANTARLVQVNCCEGTIKVLAEDQQYDFSDPELLVHPLSQAIQAIRIDREKPEWVTLDPTIQTDFKILEHKNSNLSIENRDLQDEHWIIKESSDVIPARYYMYDRKNKKTEFLFSSNPELEKYTLNPMKPVCFKARDGLLMHGYLTLPQGKISKDLPTVLIVHGGPWGIRDSWRYYPEVQLLANRGYAVFQINFRGSAGYGKQLLNAGKHEWGGKMHTDLLDGKQWLVNQHIANPHKVAIYGSSYGGYETLVALTFTPEEFCCGIDLFGPSNLITFLETLPPYWSFRLPWFYKSIGNVHTERDFLKSRSPLFKADQICRPLLIVQGANDIRVKQSESDQIVEAMRQHGKHVEYIVLPDEGHGFKNPSNAIKVVAIAEQFLHTYCD